MASKSELAKEIGVSLRERVTTTTKKTGKCNYHDQRGVGQRSPITWLLLRPRPRCRCRRRMQAEGSFVAALDVGTTFIKCHIYDTNAKSVGHSETRVNLEHPQAGWTEMKPENVWNCVKQVIGEAIASANLAPRQISCLGMSTLRNTFVTWDKETGEPFHNFIVWTDLRANELVNAWNSAFYTKVIRIAAGLLYKVTGNKRYLAASALRVANNQVNVRLKWALDNVEELRVKAAQGKALFGTMDTWLLWKFSDGQVHATDYSCASSTALYDPFLMQWSDFALNSFNIPKGLLPQVKDTSGLFCTCPAELFGAAIPISAVVADQQASMFGQCCFDPGDVKCTMGTGGFMDLNTGHRAHASSTGIYPLVGWKIGDEVVYLAEASVNDVGSVVSWAQSIGIFEDPSESSGLAEQVPDSGGVYFIPAFSGLQAPINDNKACAGFVGLTQSTKKTHLCRALLESLAFRIYQIHRVMRSEVALPQDTFRTDGGVAKNDFVVQLIADLTGRSIERPIAVEMSSLGAAFLAGLAVGVWKSKDELRRLMTTDKVFTPRKMDSCIKDTVDKWMEAVERCGRWY